MVPATTILLNLRKPQMQKSILKYISFVLAMFVGAAAAAFAAYKPVLGFHGVTSISDLLWWQASLLQGLVGATGVGIGVWMVQEFYSSQQSRTAKLSLAAFLVLCAVGFIVEGWSN